MDNNIKRRIKVYAALPVLNEFNNIFKIIDDLLSQEDVNMHLVVCVNQPDEWWNLDKRISICLENQKTIEYIASIGDKRITCIDKSSKGKGWIGKKHGVGFARKVAMDMASELADEEDLIITADADTLYNPGYVKAVLNAFNKYPDSIGFSAPYYHLLTGDEITDKCMLRYEIYMRNYALNMLLIENPYAFSAIGSGMACRVKIYRKVRGITPKMSGEDFYFIQKLRKAGKIIVDCDEMIFPGSRFSDRVYFGTGPAMIKGRAGDWSSYPIYKQDQFLEIKASFDRFGELFKQDVTTPLDTFLLNDIGSNGDDVSKIWNPLRDNCQNEKSFIKAAIQKVDGLKILQYLKSSEMNCKESNEFRLKEFLCRNFNPGEEIIDVLERLLEVGFMRSEVKDLNLIRDFMFVNERKLQKLSGSV